MEFTAQNRPTRPPEINSTISQTTLDCFSASTLLPLWVSIGSTGGSMRALPLSVALLALALLGACRSYNVSYDYDVTATYGRYHTFDYYTSKKGTGGTTTLT